MSILYGELDLLNPKCAVCGADYLLHHSETLQCPGDGREAPVGRVQGWEKTTFIPAREENQERRAELCVKHCEGIPNEYLEAGTAEWYHAYVKRDRPALERRISDLTDQCDRALEAAERLRESLEKAARDFVSANGTRPEWWTAVLDLYQDKQALAATEPATVDAKATDLAKYGPELREWQLDPRLYEDDANVVRRIYEVEDTKKAQKIVIEYRLRISRPLFDHNFAGGVKP